MNVLLPALVLLGLLGPSAQGITQQHKPAAKKAAPKATASKAKPRTTTSAKRSAAGTRPAARSTKPAPARTASKSRTAARTATARVQTRRGSKRPAPAPRRYVQNAPTPERYQEIQQALASRGHYKGQINGTWGSDSVEALKQFQLEQNLAPSGKLDSMTLIALGLGPKRNLAAGAVPDFNSLPRPQDDHRRSQGSERP